MTHPSPVARRVGRSGATLALALAVLVTGTGTGCGPLARDVLAVEPRPSPPPTVPTPVYSFADVASVEGWSTQNDPVMGGRSRSTVRHDDGRLVFEGIVSLENNGGFASVVGPVVAADDAARLAERNGLRLSLRGDGKTYVVQVRAAGRVAWISRVPTSGGEESIEVPWSGFVAVDRFLNPVSGAPTLEPARIERLAVYILDKQVGPFRLELRTIG
jgi:hypothetical protein